MREAVSLSVQNNVIFDSAAHPWHQRQLARAVKIGHFRDGPGTRMRHPLTECLVFPKLDLAPSEAIPIY